MPSHIRYSDTEKYAERTFITLPLTYHYSGDKIKVDMTQCHTQYARGRRKTTQY